MPFGAAIRKLREESGISVDKLTEMIGVKAARWRKWEEKDFDPRDEDQARIEAFFGMPLTDIGKLSDIRRFLKVPNRLNAKPDKSNAAIEELTPGQILSMLAKANSNYAESLKVQVQILRDIRIEMALSEVQKQHTFSLADIQDTLKKISKVQNQALRWMESNLSGLRSGTGTSRAVNKKKADSDGG